MNKKIRAIVLILSSLILSNSIQAQPKQNELEYFNWFNAPRFGRLPDNTDAKKMPLIKVKGNRFIKSPGDTILFRGVAIADPDKLDQEGRWNKDIFRYVKEFGATVVRIPVHPVPWRMRTPEKYLNLLDQAVKWCTELDMYIIVDWHSIGNLGMELFQNPVYNTTRKETYEFWRIIASRYKGNNTIAFYEIFNEPTLGFGQMGSMSWTEWKKINENIIQLIRAFDKEKIVLVAGFDWAYDLTPIRTEPVEADGIAYVTHPYANKCKRPYEPKWEEAFGFAAGRYPVIATEFGFSFDKKDSDGGEEYGKEIISYLENKKISWVCWVFDPEWLPRLVETWAPFKLTRSGEFFKQALHQNIQK